MNNKDLPEIMGYNKTSEAGFNLFATSIFLFGCNLRCPYCMNGRIVVVKPEDWDKPVKTVNIDDIHNVVVETQSEWVMISGGEPTVTPIWKMENLINEIKSWGCKVGMSTNGTYPEVMQLILPKLDYVAMDFKSPKQSDYAVLDIKNKDASFDKVQRTHRLLRIEKEKRPDFKYEIRTTLYPKMINADNIGVIGSYLYNDETWVLQQFRHAKNMLDEKEAKSVTPFEIEELNAIVKKAEKFAGKVVLRYV